MNLFVYDHTYYQIKNVEAFINNNAIQVKELRGIYITSDLMDLLINNINMEMHPSPDQGVQDLLKHIRDESGSYTNLSING